MHSAAPAFAPIRVLIADDSAVMREALSRAIESTPTLRVCGAARHGEEALQMVRDLKPDVITLDVDMPDLDGIEVLRRIMFESPRPVIIVSSFTEQQADVTIEALNLGAFDYLHKLDSGHAIDPRRLKKELIAKIEAAARSPLGRSSRSLQTAELPHGIAVTQRVPATPQIVAIGTSTGGPQALQEILPNLPGDLPVAVIVVQHMPPGFTAPLAKRLNTISAIEVREAEHGDVVQPGNVYIAPAGRHLRVRRRSEAGESLKTQICLSDHPASVHKPSADVMMISIAEAFGKHSCGIILTGMGADGLQGMIAISRAGGLTIGQDEATSAVYGMPRVCAERGILHKVVSLPQIPAHILQALHHKMQ
jgi:two-component system chemotaxis response regulator CheB